MDHTDGGDVSLHWPVIVLIFALLIMSGAGARFYHQQELALTGRVEDDLTAVARLKADQIVAWRKDQL
ncbi:MAG: hypothetical protein JW781_05185 [Deltaproteobacteria bacterium]|nr:hypothetical protein [Candidatus Anaeroferrophillacea bacterium]